MSSQRVDVGSLVAIPVGHGAFFAIWIRDRSEDWTQFAILEGSWSSLPSARALRSAPKAPYGPGLLPGYKDEAKGAVQGPVPADFSIVGKRDVSAEERALSAAGSGTMVFQDYEHVRSYLRTQWRLVHDREALVAEWERARQVREQRAQLRREKLTLKGMLRERIFTGSAERYPPQVVRKARQIFRDATRDLIALGEGGTRRSRATILKRIVTEFNVLDDTTGCVETVEREQIVARVGELARLVGLDNDDEKLTGHRDW